MQGVAEILECRMAKVTLARTGLGWLRLYATLLGQTGAALCDTLHCSSGASCSPRVLVSQETLLRCTAGPDWGCDFELHGGSGFLQPQSTAHLETLERQHVSQPLSHEFLGLFAAPQGKVEGCQKARVVEGARWVGGVEKEVVPYLSKTWDWEAPNLEMTWIRVGTCITTCYSWLMTAARSARIAGTK